MTTTIIGIDPGSEVSGICFIKDNIISSACNENNASVVSKIKELLCGEAGLIVIEDIFPYSTMLKPQVIATCKFIGELNYRLPLDGHTLSYIARNTVKKWAFDSFPDICLPRITAKIEYLNGWREKRGERGLKSKDGSLRKPSFQFVDDRIVIASVKAAMGIADPKPGKPNQYGLKDHSWQALAAILAYRSLQPQG